LYFVQLREAGGEPEIQPGYQADATVLSDWFRPLWTSGGLEEASAFGGVSEQDGWAKTHEKATNRAAKGNMLCMMKGGQDYGGKRWEWAFVMKESMETK
jgi:hypothetical protein